MREIKFRAWHQLQGRFIDIFDVSCFGDILTVGYSDLGEPGTNITNKVQLSQYTGLKDKNGNEIYDGDFIKYSGNSRIWEIYFDTENLQFRMKSTDKSAKIETVHRYPFHELGTLEIIGNIYENPELIKS